MTLFRTERVTQAQPIDKEACVSVARPPKGLTIRNSCLTVFPYPNKFNVKVNLNGICVFVLEYILSRVGGIGLENHKRHFHFIDDCLSY